MDDARHVQRTTYEPLGQVGQPVPVSSRESRGVSFDEPLLTGGTTANGQHEELAIKYAGWDGPLLCSRPLTELELQDLYHVQGHMPRLEFSAVPQNPDEVTQRVARLDHELRDKVKAICERLTADQDDQEKSWSCCRDSFLRRYLPVEFLHLGIIKEILPTCLFYMIYANIVAYYSSWHNWETRWSLAVQDNIYYPAVVLSFLLCFRASGCMDRYKQGLETLHEMEKAMREVAFEVFTKLSIADDVEDEEDAEKRNVCTKRMQRRYFQHEFRRLLRVLFVCAARDLNDSALEEGDISVEDAEKFPLSTTDVEYSAIRVTHSAYGHAFRVYLVTSWLLKAVQKVAKEGLFDDDDVARITQERLGQFKDAWLKARQVAYSSMPSTVTHILWWLTTVMNLFMPWEWVTMCQCSTWFPSLMLTISFYGILQIATSMENPFGFDSDDIPLPKVASQLDEEICLIMNFSVLDEVGGENLYRSMMGEDMVRLDSSKNKREADEGELRLDGDFYLSGS